MQHTYTMTSKAVLYKRGLDPDTVAELVEMLEWWRRVRETPVARRPEGSNVRSP